MKLSILLSISILALTHSVIAQSVGVGTTTPDASAVLDMTSTSGGLLVPRMTAVQRQAISSPAVGLMVFDSTNKAFYYFTGAGWLELLAGSVDKIIDADGDTKIQVEESPDEDIIRFDMGGQEHFRFKGPHIHVTQGNSVFLGGDAGLNDDLTNNENVYIGKDAGRSSTGATNNTAVGAYALDRQVLGSFNTSIGWSSLTNATQGSNSTAVGATALRDNVNGSNNVAVGSQALVTNINGGSNVAVGALAGQLTLGSGNVFLGNSAGKNETGSNTLYIDNSATTEPLLYGDFNTDLLRVNGTLRIKNAYSLPIVNGTAGHFLRATAGGAAEWAEPSVTLMQDIDADTRIQAEESPDDDVIRFDVAGHQAMWIDSLGRVNVHGASDTSQLTLYKDSTSYSSHVSFQGSGTTYNIGTPDADRLRVWTSAAGEALTVNPNGHVGINSSSPDTTLHVQGSIKMVDGKQGAGKILMSDASGIAEWIDPRQELILPDTTFPIPIKYHQQYILVHPVDNAMDIDWQMAVDTCLNLVAFGHDDWYLPSLLELNAMYKQSYLITGLAEQGMVKYWSATESGLTDAFTQRLDYGGPDPDVKTDQPSHHCRCIRKD